MAPDRLSPCRELRDGRGAPERARHHRCVPVDAIPLDPLYRPLDGPEGDRFHATLSTTGPWFADAQHVGPPSALLARALERCDPRPGMQLSRMTVEVLGPVPAGEVRVSAGVERAGRTIELLAARTAARLAARLHGCRGVALVAGLVRRPGRWHDVGTAEGAPR